MDIHTASIRTEEAVGGRGGQAGLECGAVAEPLREAWASESCCALCSQPGRREACWPSQVSPLHCPGQQHPLLTQCPTSLWAAVPPCLGGLGLAWELGAGLHLLLISCTHRFLCFGVFFVVGILTWTFTNAVTIKDLGHRKVPLKSF